MREIVSEYCVNVLGEVHQSLKIKFAFAEEIDEKRIRQLHQFVLCRDFLSDIIYFNRTGKRFEIYGFRSDVAIRDENVGLILRFPTKEVCNNFKNNFDILVNVENVNNMRHSHYELVDDLHVFVKINDIRWISTCLGISLYSFLLRICGYQYKDKDNFLDEILKFDKFNSDKQLVVAHYSSSLISNFSTIIDVADSNVTGYINKSDNYDVYNVHHTTGIRSVVDYARLARVNINVYANRLREIGSKQ